MIALRFCYYSIAPYTFKGNISAVLLSFLGVVSFDGYIGMGKHS